MLLPEKHIRISESLISLSSFALENLKKPKTIDKLWFEFKKINNTEKFPAYHTVDNLILSVDFLFCIGAVTEGSDGRLILCD